MCKMLCEPQRSLRLKTKTKFKPQRAQRNAEDGKCVRYSANLSVLCGPRTKTKLMKNQTAESAEGRRGWVNVSDTLRTSAYSAVQKLTETFKTINLSRVQSQKKITKEKHGIK